MDDNTISADPESAKQSAQKIAQHIQSLPSAATVSHHHGTAVGVTSGFHSAMAETAASLPLAVTNLRDLLQSSQDAIEKTVASLLSQDESMADEAKAMLAGIDAVVSASPTTAKSPPHGASPAPADDGGWG